MHSVNGCGRSLPVGDNDECIETKYICAKCHRSTRNHAESQGLARDDRMVPFQELGISFFLGVCGASHWAMVLLSAPRAKKEKQNRIGYGKLFANPELPLQFPLLSLSLSSYL